MADRLSSFDRYHNFDKLMKRPGFEIFKFVYELELHQGFGDPSKLCE